MTRSEGLHCWMLQALSVAFVLLVMGVLWGPGAASAITACGPLLIGLG